MQVPFYRHALNDKYSALVAEVLSGPFLTTGRHCAEVEERIREYFGVPHAKLTSSWTTGAVAALLALEIGPGDEVIVPAMTFVATANVAKLVGARPIFVDVEPGTLLMDLSKIRTALTPRTKAVIPVHLYGQMVDIRALRRIVGPNVHIIEDAAHCFEGTRGDRRPGQDGDVAIFSFYATKNLTCGEGGAVISRDAEFAGRLSQTVLHGMSAGAEKRFQGGRYQHWNVVRLGIKANLPDLLAVLLKPQLDLVEERRAEREALAFTYETNLRGSIFTFLLPVADAVSARHLFPVWVPPHCRDVALELLALRGIGATVNYRSVSDLDLYRQDWGEEDRFPVARNWGEGTLSLPLFPGLGKAEQDHVLDVLLNEVQPALRELAGIERVA